MNPDPLLPNHTDNIPSPAIVIDWPTVTENVRRMIAMAPRPDLLRPHLKTHKLPQVIRHLAALGVTKAKCATIAEAEMAADAGAKDILVASQPVGPGIARFLTLVRRFPHVSFATIADDEATLHAISAAATATQLTARLFLDIDVGQHRTGIAPGPDAARLYHLIASLPSLTPGGLHAYDGHLHQTDLTERTAACHDSFAPVMELQRELTAAGLPVPAIVAGGSPTFPIHAQRGHVECSPGTCVLWDAGYAAKLPDLPFTPAASLLTRVISRPTPGHLCLDLGHKALASEMPHPRAIFPAIPDASPIMHNEEHLVIATSLASQFPVGSPIRAIPWHICPTIALHSFVHALTSPHQPAEIWPVTARTRQISC
jgi:D-serine deaminase-like pyridoxal phosphate-dependent protein